MKHSSYLIFQCWTDLERWHFRLVISSSSICKTAYSGNDTVGVASPSPINSALSSNSLVCILSISRRNQAFSSCVKVWNRRVNLQFEIFYLCLCGLKMTPVKSWETLVRNRKIIIHIRVGFRQAMNEIMQTSSSIFSSANNDFFNSSRPRDSNL